MPCVEGVRNKSWWSSQIGSQSWFVSSEMVRIWASLLRIFIKKKRSASPARFIALTTGLNTKTSVWGYLTPHSPLKRFCTRLPSRPRWCRFSSGVFPVDNPEELGPVEMKEDQVIRVLDKPNPSPVNNTWGIAAWSPKFTALPKSTPNNIQSMLSVMRFKRQSRGI